MIFFREMSAAHTSKMVTLVRKASVLTLLKISKKKPLSNMNPHCFLCIFDMGGGGVLPWSRDAQLTLLKIKMILISDPKEYDFKYYRFYEPLIRLSSKSLSL